MEQEQAKGPVVEVENLKTNETEKFHMPWDSTVAQVWDEAYRKLDESRGPADEFQCQDGTKLSAHLNLTLADLRDREICQHRKFAIRGPTGGA